jgi:molecular chaperone DnaK (HSP70)
MDNYKDMSIVVGIDLGTTNSCVSYYSNGQLTIIKDEGKSVIPSQVYFYKKMIYIGNEIPEDIKSNTKNLIYDVKRLIGRSYSDKYVESKKTFFSYDIENINDNIYIKTPLGPKTPEDISALILNKIKLLVMEQLGTTKKIKAVVTIPAYFNDKQKQATKKAIDMSGLELIRIINEPTAAALYYGINELDDKERNVFVFDFGGGTLDVSLLNIDDGFFQVIATDGDSFLGGQDFTQCIYEYCIKEFKRIHDLEAQKISIHNLKLHGLKLSCENAKIKLSEFKKVTVHVLNFWGTTDLNIEIHRDEFNLVCQDLVSRAFVPVTRLFHQQDIKISDITDVLLVGGSSNIPIIRQQLTKFFKQEPKIVDNLENIVSAGAAIQGYLLENKITSLSKEITLVDVLPLSLGIKTSDGLFSPVIRRNTSIPVKRSARYTTDNDNETSIKIEIYEGEREFCDDNFLIGEFELSGIKKQKKGLALIEVSFFIDKNGLIQVTAKDIKGDVENTLFVERKSIKMEDGQIEEIIKKAEDRLTQDIEEKSIILKCNEIKDIIFIIKSCVKYETTKLSDDDKTIIINEMDEIQNRFHSLNANELLLMINNLKKKYSTLLLVDQTLLNDKEDTKDFSLINDVKDEQKKNDYINADHISSNDDSIESIKQRIIERCSIYKNQMEEDDDYLQEYLMSTILLIKNKDFDIDLLIAKENEMIKFAEDHIRSKNSGLGEVRKMCEMILKQIKDGDLSQDGFSLNDEQLIDLNLYVTNVFEETNAVSKNNIYWKNKVEEINDFCENLLS